MRKMNGSPRRFSPDGSGSAGFSWSAEIGLKLRRRCGYTDGHLYIVLAATTDMAGNSTKEAVTVCVPHDMRKKGKP